MQYFDKVFEIMAIPTFFIQTQKHSICENIQSFAKVREVHQVLVGFISINMFSKYFFKIVLLQRTRRHALVQSAELVYVDSGKDG